MKNLEPLRQAATLLAQGDWQRAHVIAQDDESQIGCWLHGIVHLLEGDRDNAHYWYRRAGRAPPKDFCVENGLAALSETIPE